jgi:hypothetical protein
VLDAKGQALQSWPVVASLAPEAGTVVTPLAPGAGQRLSLGALLPLYRVKVEPLQLIWEGRTFVVPL